MAYSSDPGCHGLVAYTYLHLPIVAGIIIGAVAGGWSTAIVISGPLPYLMGLVAFKWASDTRRLPPLSHLAGVPVARRFWIAWDREVTSPTGTAHRLAVVGQCPLDEFEHGELSLRIR